MTMRLWFHAAHLSPFLIMGAALLGVTILFLIALVNLRRNGSIKGAGLGLLLPLMLALAILPSLKFAIGGFDVLAPHYNLWLVPLFSLFIVTALADRKLHRVALAAAFLLIGAHLVADYRLIQHAETYSHGPGEWIAAQITDPEATIVIHDSNGNWGHAYFPLYYLTAGKVTQIIRDQTGADRIVRDSGIMEFEGSVRDYSVRIYVRTASLNSNELSKRLSEPGNCGIPAMTADHDGVAEIRSFCAFESATIVVVRQAGE